MCLAGSSDILSVTAPIDTCTGTRRLLLVEVPERPPHRRSRLQVLPVRTRRATGSRPDLQTQPPLTTALPRSEP